MEAGASRSLSRRKRPLSASVIRSCLHSNRRLEDGSVHSSPRGVYW
jgi:hypothetical protein